MHQHTNQIRKFIETNVFLCASSSSSILLGFFFLFEWSTWRKTLMSMIQLDTVSSFESNIFVSERMKFHLIRCSRIYLRLFDEDSLYRLSHLVCWNRIQNVDRKQYARYRKYKTHFTRTQRNVAILFLEYECDDAWIVLVAGCFPSFFLFCFRDETSLIFRIMVHL